MRVDDDDVGGVPSTTDEPLKERGYGAGLARSGGANDRRVADHQGRGIKGDWDLLGGGQCANPDVLSVGVGEHRPKIFRSCEVNDVI